MKQCKNCKAHLSIDPKMTRCPRCQSDLRHWVDRHPFLTVFVFIIAIILFVNRGGGDKKKTAINPTPVKQEKTEVTVVPVSGELTNLLEYSMAVGFIFKAAGEASTARADQLEKYPNWNKIDSDLFYMAGNIIESAYESLTKLTPPKILGSVHQKALKGLGLWKQSVSTTNKGLDNLDKSLLKESVYLMNEGTRWVNEADEELKEITEEMKKTTKK